MDKYTNVNNKCQIQWIYNISRFKYCKKSSRNTIEKDSSGRANQLYFQNNEYISGYHFCIKCDVLYIVYLSNLLTCMPFLGQNLLSLHKNNLQFSVEKK